MEKKIVFITGAAQGIGFEVGKTFAEADYTVILSDRNDEVIDKATELKDLGYDCEGIVCDVTSEKEIKDALNKTMERHRKIDILVNNAGLQYVAPIEDFPTERFELLLKVMLTAPFIVIKHLFPSMKKNGFGRIVNMASINGLVGFAGKAAYNSAKHGVIGLTKVAALEGAAHGITVNAICPGYVDTPLVRGQLKSLAETRKVPLERVLEDVIYPLVPQKRLLEPKEIADYVLFLSSEKAKGITGQAVVLDGGYTAQ